MLVLLQIIIVIVLLLTMYALLAEERRKRKSSLPLVRLTSSWEDKNRRFFTRIEADLSATYHRPKKNNSGVRSSTTRNISMGGVCILIKEKLTISEKISLTVSLPECSNPITVLGEVVWVKEDVKHLETRGIRAFEIGVQFKEISSMAQDELFRFIKERGKISCE